MLLTWGRWFELLAWNGPKMLTLVVLLLLMMVVVVVVGCVWCLLQVASIAEQPVAREGGCELLVTEIER